MSNPINLTHVGLDALNDRQLAAVTAPLSNQLILAGAGSGKTRVLTHRIAYLINQQKILPSQILAVTFTNKAATEIHTRLMHLLPSGLNQLWVGTFHGLCHRLLRIHWEAANLSPHFNILDAEDQLRVIRRAQTSLNLSDQEYAAKEIRQHINQYKEEKLLPTPRRASTQVFWTLYTKYHELMTQASAIDFSDLLLKTNQLLATNANIRDYYANKFRTLLIDEFQDTNQLQYEWIKLIGLNSAAVTVVGDDDQSIYRWRGGRIENIHNFQNDFPNVVVFTLEQNYRSTKNILQAANALIAQNPQRFTKKLWTASTAGEKITLYSALDEGDEAYFVATSIRKLIAQGRRLDEFALLYRSNAQSRVLEEALIYNGLPYRIHGGLRFFARQEIKDAIAYLRCATNPEDDIALERIINFPPRGIGDKTLATIEAHARMHKISRWQAILALTNHAISDQSQPLTPKARNCLIGFVNLMAELTQYTPTPLAECVSQIIQHSGLINHYQQEKDDKSTARSENLSELINAAHQFEDTSPTTIPHDPLNRFLAYTALESNFEDNSADNQYIQLLTLHSAKGLEFPIVFLTGCEEDLFPSPHAAYDKAALAEERRLCYVGITRAMEKLYLTYAKIRRQYGKYTYRNPSRFLHELPASVLDTACGQTKAALVNPTMTAPAASVAPNLSFQPKQTVYHPSFGAGEVISCEGSGEYAKVTVEFPALGCKRIIGSFLRTEAPLPCTE